MAKMKTNRTNFGNVRQLKSVRWQARYPSEEGPRMVGPVTYATSKEAWTHVSGVQSDRARGVYHDPRRGERLLADFATEWINNGGSRGKLAIGTTELYEDLLKRHIAPTIGKKSIGKITTAMVRSWYTALGKELAARAAQPRADGGKRSATGQVRLRQSYAFLKGVMSTATADGLIGKNPCQIKGAGMVRSPERPFMSIADFVTIMQAMPEDLRPVLALTFGGHLRLGEVPALIWSDLDLKAGTLLVERQIVQTRLALIMTPTKTEDTRRVDLPDITLKVMSEYLKTVPRGLPSAPLFLRADGKALTRAQLQHAFQKARASVGLEQFHFHDVRHSGLTVSAQGGATTRELMARAGHSTMSAAMKYQHAADERGKVVASRMNDAMAEAIQGAKQA